MTTLGDEIFIAGDNAVYRADRNMNPLQTYTSWGSGYRGIYYEERSEIFYVCNGYSYNIDVLSRNLTFVDSINVWPNRPYSIIGHNGRLYVGNTDYSGRVLVIENKVIIYTIKGCNGYSSFI